jgi:hypothetical protein
MVWIAIARVAMIHRLPQVTSPGGASNISVALDTTWRGFSGARVSLGSNASGSLATGRARRPLHTGPHCARQLCKDTVLGRRVRVAVMRRQVDINMEMHACKRLSARTC